jgi:hypothetical protein
MQNRVKNRTLSEKKRNPTALQDTVPTEHAIAIVDIQIVNTWKVSFGSRFPNQSETWTNVNVGFGHVVVNFLLWKKSHDGRIFVPNIL